MPFFVHEEQWLRGSRFSAAAGGGGTGDSDTAYRAGDHQRIAYTRRAVAVRAGNVYLIVSGIVPGIHQCAALPKLQCSIDVFPQCFDTDRAISCRSAE